MNKRGGTWEVGGKREMRRTCEVDGGDVGSREGLSAGTTNPRVPCGHNRRKRYTRKERDRKIEIKTHEGTTCSRQAEPGNNTHHINDKENLSVHVATPSVTQSDLAG